MEPTKVSLPIKILKNYEDIFNFQYEKVKGKNGKYTEKLIRLAKGNAGSVYCVQKKNSKSTELFALKVLKFPTLIFSEIMNYREVTIAKIPGILPLLEIYVQEETVGLLMPKGESISEWWNQKQKSLNNDPIKLLKNLFAVSKKMIEIIGNLHVAGIVYRDIHLSNFIVFKDNVYLIDFDQIARLMGTKNEAKTIHVADNFTILRYAAPELLASSFAFKSMEKTDQIKKQLNMESISNSNSMSTSDVNTKEWNRIFPPKVNKSKSNKKQKKVEENSDSEQEKDENDCDDKEEKESDSDSENDPMELQEYDSDKEEEEKVDKKQLMAEKFYESFPEEKQFFYNHKVDIWSIGCCILKLWLGKDYFRGDFAEVLWQYAIHYYQRYGKWPNNLTPEHPLFQKIDKKVFNEETIGVFFDIQLWGNRAVQNLKEQDKSTLGKMLVLFFNMIQRLLTPSPSGRMDCHDILKSCFVETDDLVAPISDSLKFMI